MESKNNWYPTLREHVGNNLLICNSEDCCTVIISMVYISVNILYVQLIILAAQDDPNAIHWVMLLFLCHDAISEENILQFRHPGGIIDVYTFSPPCGRRIVNRAITMGFPLIKFLTTIFRLDLDFLRSGPTSQMESSWLVRKNQSVQPYQQNLCLQT